MAKKKATRQKRVPPGWTILDRAACRAAGKDTTVDIMIDLTSAMEGVLHARRTGGKVRVTTIARCLYCRKPVRTTEMRGGYCDECNKQET